MSMQSVSLSQITPSKGNPRRTFDAKTIEGLAASIKTDGLLQNLVVKPEGKGKRYSIIGGERRYRALKLLEQRGELPEGFAVPVEIRKGLSTDDSLRISTVENLQRANLSPLEEAAALTKLVHKGTTLENVAAQTGLSPTTIKRRLVLNGLCKEAKQALQAGEISLSQAEVLTLGSAEAQAAVLEDIRRGHSVWSADDIRATLLDERPTVALAIFPVEQYTGSITTDLFAEKEASYFDDAEQFFTLQRAAVEQLAAHHRENAAWVELTKSYSIPDWQYRKARKREASGVLINVSPSGAVDIREGLVKLEIDKETAAETAENPLAPPKAKASYATPLCRYIAHHKSAAVQEMLLASPRKAKEVGAVLTFIALKPHRCIAALAQEKNAQSAYKVLEGQALFYAAKLGLTPKRSAAVWSVFPPQWPDEAVLYEAVQTLTDVELDGLQTLLAALSFGQVNCDRLDTQDSVFNRVAGDLGVDMRNHWRPDRAFLDRRSRQQLVEIAKACGYADGRSGIGSYKKAELVEGLVRHFKTAQTSASPNPAQQKGQEWLPDVMKFPAVNPDRNEYEAGSA